MTLYFTLFAAGVLTILLPCILPLIPIVVGVSIAGRSRWRPLLTVAGMVVSFVGFTFLLLVVLREFVVAADYLRIGTYYVLLLFGVGFLTHRRTLLTAGALGGALFFLDKGMIPTAVAAVLGVIAVHLGGWVAVRLQQLGSGIQSQTREVYGEHHPATAFIIGLTMGLVWVPCAGPALGFAFTLVREEPGLRAMALLTAYGLGTALPLLLVGYGGQWAVHSVRSLNRYSGRIKQAAGVLLVLTALAFQFNIFKDIEIWFVQNTPFGNLGVDIERQLFGEDAQPEPPAAGEGIRGEQMKLPYITPAPQLRGLGPWHNSEPFALSDLEGKVVLIDFWTYSCINCIRTLPYLRQYWERYGGPSLAESPFVLLGVHTPEFTFEKSRENVAQAIDDHELTYPVAQDNDYATWDAFNNRYWPAKYLIGPEGYIRYTHFGEGAYEETDRAIRSLLAEAGAAVEVEGQLQEEQASRRPRSPETYVGRRSWDSFANRKGPPTEAVMTYALPNEVPIHHYALAGDWQLTENERQVLRSSEGTIRMRFLGSEINLVLGPPETGEATAEVFVDGEKTKTITVDFADMYRLWDGPYGEHVVELRIEGEGMSAYAFTFGG